MPWRLGAPLIGVLLALPSAAATPDRQHALEEQARQLGAEADKLRQDGQLAPAITAWEKKLTLDRELASERAISGDLVQLAKLHLYSQDLVKARASGQEALALLIKLHGEQHYLVIQARQFLSDVERMTRFTPEERARNQEMLRLQDEAIKVDKLGHSREAAPLAEQALAIQRQLFGDRHPDTMKLHQTLGAILVNGGRTAEAQPHLEQAVEVAKSLLGEDHPETAQALSNLGNLWRAQGEYAKAQRNYEEALAIRRKVLGEKHTATATSWNLLGLAYKLQGNYPAARRAYEQALNIRIEVLGKDHHDTAIQLNNIGTLLRESGDYGGARVHLERAVAILEKLPGGEKHPDTAQSLDNLALVLLDLGDAASALPRVERALAIYREARGENHPDTAISLNNQALVLHSLGELEAARRTYEEALAVRRRVSGELHPAVALSLKNIGALYREQGDFPTARKYEEQALAIEMKSLGENHPSTALTLRNIGLLLQTSGDPVGARPYFDRAMAIQRQALGDYHRETATTMRLLAGLLLERGELGEARRLYEQAIGTELRLAEDYLETLSEAEALAYVETIQSSRDWLLSVLRRLPGDSAGEAYRWVWNSRGLATRVLEARRAAVGETREAAELWDKLKSTRGQLAKLTTAAPRPDRAKARQEQLGKLNAEKERLERELARVSARFRDQQETRRVGFGDLMARLPGDVAVVDLVQVMHYAPPAGRKGALERTREYDAFVVRQSAAPAWIHLGAAEPIDRSIRAWRQELATAPARPSATGRKLRQLLWQPLSAQLAWAQTLVIIPDAALTRVPWAALPGERPGAYLLDEHAVTTVGNGQQLYDLLGRGLPAGDGALLVGGVQYDSAPVVAPDRRLAVVHRGPARDWKRPAHWTYLRGSLKEVEQIAGLRADAAPGDVLSGGAASEEALRQRMPGARFVHLATHGFFADPATRSVFQHDAASERLLESGFAMSGPRATVTGRNPLLLSGIVLSGANLPQERNQWGAPVGDDGILTAEEAAALDLGGTELVVLSACETGLGEVAGGEGVFGLQRAFGMAGARAVVASLWDLDDRATQALMIDFYRNLWQRKLGKLEALRQAQLARAHAAGARGKKPLSPYYWAGFVFAGDWR